MLIQDLQIPDIKLISPQVFGDDRGFFFNALDYTELSLQGVDFEPVQENFSKSSKGVLRGVHFQKHHFQAKVINVIVGEIFDVAVDLRVGSPTFGKWSGVYLNDQNKNLLYIPEGFAHGFVVTSEFSTVSIKVSKPYTPGLEAGVFWADDELGIDWPIKKPIVSNIDDNQMSFGELKSKKYLPIYTGSRTLIERHSCFLSHSSNDYEFAFELREKLSQKGISVWFAPTDMSLGDRIRETLENAISANEKFVLLLSKNAIESDWVEQEVEAVFEKENEVSETILIPVTIDKAIFSSNKGWAKKIRRTRNIGDFSMGLNELAFEESLSRLVLSLTPKS